ncbi:MAG: FtsW/RodA/SpoVE family cell cycle protein [Chloroherpetonaceae bacterium]|nr:FtsW/RodA/SpoVE family cell cycle protein [Chthonomonadaceae bacterium]MDW8206561.1 FtsW/RodA/SpoVE family cell cycle protein [Chloroherpetonaceae bacterium]
MKRLQRKIEMTLTLSVAAILLPIFLLVYQGRMVTTSAGEATRRSAAEVFWHFHTGCGLFLILLLLAPPLLRRRLGGDPFLMPIALLLSGLGVATLFSIKDPLRDAPAYLHHLIGIALSLPGMVFCALLRPGARQQLRRYAYLWALGALGLVAGLALFGTGPEGVRLSLFRAFQPIEFIKLLLILFLAGYLSDRAATLNDASTRWHVPILAGIWRRDGRPALSLTVPRATDLGPLLVMWMIALILLIVIRDLGPGALLLAVFAVMLYMATGRGMFLIAGIALLITAGILAYYTGAGVLPTRVDMWLHPFDNPHPNGAQLGQALWALATGGVPGSGLGLGMPGAIPRAGSDMVFISWAEETGLAGAWLVMILFVVLVWRGMRIALQAHTEFDRMLASGLTCLLGLQALMILGGVTGAIPLTGLSLPFMSYGNSALIASFLIIGLLRGISATPDNQTALPVRPERVQAAQRFTIGFALLLLFGIGVARVTAVQWWRSEGIATRTLHTPDQDGITRPHVNPRLMVIARSIVRGSIYDRQGRVLATSRPEEIRQLLPPGQARQWIAGQRRLYPLGPACAHLIGYVDPLVGGPTGLERTYNTQLRGFETYGQLLSDYRRRHSLFYRPRKAHDLYLTLDAARQQAIYRLLVREVGQLKDRRDPTRRKERAALVMLTPGTGEIRVAVSLPSFDPNALTPGYLRQVLAAPDSQDRALLLNRVVQGWYPPGSTFKIATAACALDLLPDAERFAVVCNRVAPPIRWQAGGRTYVRRNTRDDPGDPGFGRLTLAPAFRVSSNIYFAYLAVHIGAERYRAYLIERCGFQRVPAPEAFHADLPDIGYGQGRMLVSPLEMAQLAATVVDGGWRRTPRLVAYLHDRARQQRIVPASTPPYRMMRPETAAALHRMMRDVVTAGTARGVFASMVDAVAGKTGTAQNERADREPHSWFVGYEIKATRTAFACVVENGGYGRRVAAVLCWKALQQYARSANDHSRVRITPRITYRISSTLQDEHTGPAEIPGVARHRSDFTAKNLTNRKTHGYNTGLKPGARQFLSAGQRRYDLML